jgi:hypothetical protein
MPGCFVKLSLLLDNTLNIINYNTNVPVFQGLLFHNRKGMKL